MTQPTDIRPAATTPNIQDAFLNQARRDRVVVKLRLMDGTEFEGRIKHFDRFAIILERNGGDQMVFKHAVATITTPRTVANYLAHHQP